MRMLYPLMLDGEQPAGDVLALLRDPELPQTLDFVLVRYRERLTVRWAIAPIDLLTAACEKVAPRETLAIAMLVAPFHLGVGVRFAHAARVDLGTLDRKTAGRDGWLVVFSGARFVGVVPQAGTSGRSAPPVASMASPASGAEREVPAPAPAPPPPPPPPAAAAPRGATRGSTRSKQRNGEERSTPVGASREESFGRDAPAVGNGAAAGAVETLEAIARVDAPAAVAPSPTASATIVIGLAPAPSPTAEGVMRFTSAVSETRIDIGVMVEAPDFTSVTGFKHTLTVDKADPFTATVTVVLVPLAPADRQVREATLRVHYTYLGQPAGVVMRTIVLGDATMDEVAAITLPRDAPLSITGTQTPVDLTIRIARRDQSDSARELIWTITDCAHPGVALPLAPLVQKFGDRDNASSFASRITRQVNDNDNTVKIHAMLRGLGTQIRRAMPPELEAVLAATAAAVGLSRLARVLLLTDECHVPWELAFLESPPDPARAPFLGAQFAVSRWIHGEHDIPVPPPATLTVHDLAIVLGTYENSSMPALPHAKDESAALSDEAARVPALFPRVTSVSATADALVDLLDGALPTAAGSTMAPEMVHFACHGEVLGTGVARRSVLYLNDGSPLEETLFIAAPLGRSRKSFLFMNACQVGVGGDELGQYAGFAGFAIAAGFSGFIGPLWSVNDEIAKRISIDFYKRTFGTDGTAPRPVADVLADMRSQYLSEPDPKKRQSTWLAYVHYGHPHFTLVHA